MSRPEPARWALGTAQLGMPYGVANRSGRPDEREAQRILAAAFASGVRCLDTAAAYGDAEDVIGRFLGATPGSEAMSICTKLPAVPRGMPAGALRTALRGHLDASRRRLGRDRIDVVLAHAWPDVEAYGNAYHDALEALRADGSVGAFGASVYTPDEAQGALAHRGVAAVQFPFNALDTRFAVTGITALCRRRNCASFARSPLLQGALTLAPDRLPRGLGHAGAWIGDYRALAAAHGLEPARAALAYAAQHSGADWIVAGAETAEQVETQRDALDLELPPAFVAALAARTVRAPENVIDPRRWGAS